MIAKHPIRASTYRKAASYFFGKGDDGTSGVCWALKIRAANRSEVRLFELLHRPRSPNLYWWARVNDSVFRRRRYVGVCTREESTYPRKVALLELALNLEAQGLSEG